MPEAQHCPNRQASDPSKKAGHADWAAELRWVLLCCGLLASLSTTPALGEETPPVNGSSPVILLDPMGIEKFIHELPRPIEIRHEGSAPVELSVRSGPVWMGLRDRDGERLMTTVWGFEYAGQLHSPGPTFRARTDRPIAVQWLNELSGPHLFPVDRSIHLASTKDPDAVPIVIHLHGGHSEWESDGNPLAWYTRGYIETGPLFKKKTYHYDNSQDAATIWYHDHTLGMTRLSNYAGLFGFYLIGDKNEDRLIREKLLPGEHRTIAVAIADRLFTQEGQLYFPGRRGQPSSPVLHRAVEDNWPDPSHLDEFFGNVMVVNGMVWPKVSVSPHVYRLRLLNAADTRTLVLKIDGDIPFLQIGSDGGFLDRPVRLSELVLAPAERADVLLDFSQYSGRKLIMRNFGPDVPFKGFVEAQDPEHSLALVYNRGGNRVLSDGRGGTTPPTDPQTSGQVLQFEVMPTTGSATNARDEPRALVGDLKLKADTPLRPPLHRLTEAQASRSRQLATFRLDDPYGRNLLLLGTLRDGSLFFGDPATEIVAHNAVEIWEIYNPTRSAHPIHIHLVEFQVLDRQPFKGKLIPKSQPFLHTDKSFQGARLKIEALTGELLPPRAEERGPKDTVIALPGQVTRVIAHFDREGIYVWHCHLLSHEDYDMMRPFEVRASASSKMP
ncbi:multicopper oxidase family protein [Microbulbifer spongiae]|uniref:Multicopper oxidase domain-containing protein n=1 Tax=Microbulbifer spongiae TaxID=2944933 RepID=A0ABY9EGL5_9GAMM|nr:multicopper oxidase domain-containing protein [Microbulbifer sp. MI-G]WKD51467.1 multicopper oxidase domain-containing protein [Microbulbifer sp. MI-G]